MDSPKEIVSLVLPNVNDYDIASLYINLVAALLLTKFDEVLP